MKIIILILIISSLCIRGTDLSLKYTMLVNKNNKIVFIDNNTKKVMDKLKIEHGYYSLLNLSNMKNVVKWKELSNIECENKIVYKTVIEYKTIYKTKTIIEHKYNLFSRILIISGFVLVSLAAGYTYGNR